MWNTLEKDFEERMQVVQNKLKNRFAQAKCQDKGNARKHVDRMRYRLEKLAGAGAPIMDSEYTVMLIRSMSKSYRDYIAAISVAVEVSGNSLTPQGQWRETVGQIKRKKNAAASTVEWKAT